MQNPYYSPFQFIDAAGANFAAASVSGNLNSVVSGFFRAGFINAQTVGITYSGLQATISAPLPFQALFGDGSVAAASGTTTNAVSTSYTVNVSGLVPGSGSTTAYLSVAKASIQLNPYQVLGPPPGHPDYVPTFVPYTSYLTTHDSLNFVVGTTAPDNFTTLEFGRATLAAGATGVTFSGQYQPNASTQGSFNVVTCSGAITVSQSIHAGKVLQFTANGSIALPDVNTVNGLRVEVTNISSASGTITFTASGSQNIYGWSNTGAVSTFGLSWGNSVIVEAQNGTWLVNGFSPALASTSFWGLLDGGTKTSDFSALNGFLYYCDQSAGAFTLHAPTSGVVRGSTFGLVNIGNNTMTIDWGSLVFQGDSTPTIVFPQGIVAFAYSGNATYGWEQTL